MRWILLCTWTQSKGWEAFAGLLSLCSPLLHWLMTRKLNGENHPSNFLPYWEQNTSLNIWPPKYSLLRVLTPSSLCFPQFRPHSQPFLFSLIPHLSRGIALLGVCSADHSRALSFPSSGSVLRHNSSLTHMPKEPLSTMTPYWPVFIFLTVMT